MKKALSTKGIPKEVATLKAAEYAPRKEVWGEISIDRNKTLAIILAFVFACLALGVYSYANRWQYEHIGGMLVRVNRFSGELYVPGRHVWIKWGN